MFIDINIPYILESKTIGISNESGKKYLFKKKNTKILLFKTIYIVIVIRIEYIICICEKKTMLMMFGILYLEYCPSCPQLTAVIKQE